MGLLGVRVDAGGRIAVLGSPGATGAPGVFIPHVWATVRFYDDLGGYCGRLVFFLLVMAPGGLCDLSRGRVARSHDVDIRLHLLYKACTGRMLFPSLLHGE